MTESLQELGRRGGLKGGRARADAMTPEERSQAASKAARARWAAKRQERLEAANRMREQSAMHIPEAQEGDPQTRTPAVDTSPARADRRAGGGDAA